MFRRTERFFAGDNGGKGFYNALRLETLGFQSLIDSPIVGPSVVEGATLVDIREFVAFAVCEVGSSKLTSSSLIISSSLRVRSSASEKRAYKFHFHCAHNLYLAWSLRRFLPCRLPAARTLVRVLHNHYILCHSVSTFDRRTLSSLSPYPFDQP